jgi:3',5'-cyclic AMP phosphodiesterase CpdA
MSFGRQALLGLVLLGVGVGGCGDDAVSGSDAGPDGAADARSLPDVVPVAPDPGFDEDYVAVGPDVTVTTLLETRRSKYPMDDLLVDRWDRLLIPAEEMGRRYPQPGEPHLSRDDLGAGGSVDGTRMSLLYFVHLADAQLIDTQSPSYVPANKYTTLGDSLPAFHQDGPLAPHLLDSAVQTANQFGLGRPFDFFIHTGDAIEDAQYNEVQWFLAIMDGGGVHVDSGAVDDPIPGPDNDAWDGFEARGLSAGVPWYAVVGNHDLNVNGNFPLGLIEEANEEPYLLEITPLLAEFDVTLPGVSTSDRAPNVFAPSQMPAFQANLADLDIEDLMNEEEIRSLAPGAVVPDANRSFMDGCGFVDAHFSTTTEPVGHGFTQASRQTCTGNYVVESVAGLPIRMIVLDTGPHVGGSQGVLTPPLNSDGSVNQALVGDADHDQLAWLHSELDRAVADGVAVIMVSHHASKSISPGNAFADIFNLFFPDEVVIRDLWNSHFLQPEQWLSGRDLRDLLTSYPNVFLHLVGHSHENRVNAVCPDGDLIDSEEISEGLGCEPPADGRTAANGYWEVMAASTRDFPNQFRITEVVDNGDGTGSVYSTVVDCLGGAGSLHELGLYLALADHQADGKEMDGATGALMDRNVELRFAWAPEVVTALATANGATTIESLTTLAEPAPGLPVLPIWP